MAKTITKKRRVRSKGVASRGRWKRWILIVLGVLLVMPPLQVGVLRFVNPPRTLPMWIEQASSKSPLRYRWIDLSQIPEMFLEHLWISEDQRFSA